jgi:hypothetical protein
MSAGGSFTFVVSHPTSVTDQIKELAARAKKLGLSDVFTDAIEAIYTSFSRCRWNGAILSTIRGKKAAWCATVFMIRCLCITWFLNPNAVFGFCRFNLCRNPH